MRLVTVSTALALSIAALSLSTPASALPEEKQTVVKLPRGVAMTPVKKASVQPVKKVTVVQPAKKVTVAQPAKKVAVVQTVKKLAVVQPVKKAAVASTMIAAVTPAKTVQAVKRQHAAAVAPVKPVKKVAVTKRPRIASARPMATAVATDTVAFDRHAVPGSAEFSQQMPQNVRSRRAEKTELTQGPRAPRLFASPDPVSEARRPRGYAGF